MRSFIAAGHVLLCHVLGLSLVLPAQTTAPPKPASKHSSKTPPVGPPWVTDFIHARAAAIQARKPIFVYSTKTY